MGFDWTSLLILAPLFVASITLHEFGHAAMGTWLGDSTPQEQGRLTLNPAAHLDVFGTLFLILAGFGWAKPVQVQPHRFAHPRWGMAAVAAAGPAMNVALAILAALGLLLASPHLPEGAALWFKTAFHLNVMLFVFNLLPIPPLDGGHLVESLVPRRWLPAFEQWQPWGTVLLVLIFVVPAAAVPLRYGVALASGALLLGVEAATRALGLR